MKPQGRRAVGQVHWQVRKSRKRRKFDTRECLDASIRIIIFSLHRDCEFIGRKHRLKDSSPQFN